MLSKRWGSTLWGVEPIFIDGREVDISLAMCYYCTGYIIQEGIKIKQIPNALTATRIVCSLVLLCTKPFSSLFFILYALCGTSDVLDGYIARKTNSTSQFGATLDSLADAIFIGAILIIFIPMIKCPPWLLWWIGIIVLIRLTSLLVGFIKYHTAAFLHTYANKATGFLLFFFPVLYYFLGLNVAADIICIVASVSALEELLINIKSISLSRDIKSIFSK